MQVITIEELRMEELGEHAIVVFGGTFDPVHQGHIGAIKRLQSKFSTVVIAATDNNPWKEAEATSLAIRLEMFRRVFPGVTELSKLTVSDNILESLILWTQVYGFAYEVVERIRVSHPKIPLMWAIGEDLIDDVAQWKNWQSKGVPAVVVPIEPNIHASDIRDGRAPLLPELEELAAQHKLYR